MSDTPQDTSPATRAGKFGRDLTTGSIPKHLFLFALPMLVGNLLQTSYSFINGIWVGQFLQKQALAAVTVSMPVIFVLIALAAGLTMATSILIAQYIGARNIPQVKRVVQSSVTLVGLLSLLLLIIGELVTTPLLRLMSTPEDVLPLATSYMHIILFTIPCTFAVFMIASMLRGAGDSTTPLRFQVISVVLTILLDPLLMFGWPGLPQQLQRVDALQGLMTTLAAHGPHFPGMGLNGTAVVNIATQVLVLIALVIYLQRSHHVVAPDWRHLRVDWEMWKQTFAIGLPSAVQQSIVSIGMLFVVSFVNFFKEDATAAFGVAMRIDQLAFMPSMMIGMAVSTLAGQNIGAGHYHRVRQVFWWGVLFSVSITAVVSLLVVSQPHLLISIFVSGKSSPEVLRMGTQYLQIVGLCYSLTAIMFVSNGIINGAGHTFFITLISLVSLGIVRVPLAWFFSRVVMHDVRGIWYAMAISFATSMCISLVYYASGRWKKAVIKHQRPAEIDVEEPHPCEAIAPQEG